MNFGEGLGIGLQDLARAELVDVAVLGTVRVDNVSAFTEAVSPTNSPVAGLLAFDVAELVLDDVGIRGTSYAGALLVRSGTTWTGGGVTESLGTGVLQQEGTLALTEISVQDILQGANAIPAYGLASVGGVLDTTSLVVGATRGVGLLHAGGTVAHDEVQLSSNELGGAWVQGDASLTVIGGVADQNALAGIFVASASDVSVDGMSVSGTRAVPWMTGGELSTVGDGLHLVSPGDLALATSA